MALVPAAVDALGGPIDILVNNAAAGIYKPNLGYTLKHRRLMMEVNFDAPVDLTQQVVPGMIERGEGWIVNVSSGVARYHYGPPDLATPRAKSRGVFGANQGVYGASKAALNRITVAFAAELAGTGVRVNTVEPNGAVMSDGAVARVWTGYPNQRCSRWKRWSSRSSTCACARRSAPAVCTAASTSSMKSASP